MQLPSTYYPNNSRVVTGTPIIYQDDVILLCDTSTAPVVINLLEIPNNEWLTTYKLYVVDQSSNSSVNNITINAGVGQTINNQASVILKNNGECVLVRIVGNSQYLASVATITANPLRILDEGTVLTTNASSINFTGQGVTATNVGSDVTVNVPIQPAYTTVQDEGVSLPQRTTIDFQGTGVTASDVGGKTVVTINSTTPTTISVADTTTIDLSLSGGPAYNLSANIVDTGWVDLNGFSFYSGATKPQCRRIGKVIHFRGDVVIPLSNDGGTTVIPYTGATTYYAEYFKDPWTSAGGVDLSPFGSLTFNSSNSVIPFSIASGANFDGTYAMRTIMQRVLEIKPDWTTSLSGYCSIIISNTGRLVVQVLKDVEQGLGYMNFYPSSPQRFITSYIRSTDPLPEYVGATTFIHNANAVAPGTTQLTSKDTTDNWPLSLDAALETDIGGFGFRIDGLMAFLT